MVVFILVTSDRFVHVVILSKELCMESCRDGYAKVDYFEFVAPKSRKCLHERAVGFAKLSFISKAAKIYCRIFHCRGRVNSSEQKTAQETVDSTSLGKLSSCMFT